MAGEGEQQKTRATQARNRRENLHRAEDVWQLQPAEALRQQRGPQGSLPRGRLDRRRRWHHIPQGK